MHDKSYSICPIRSVSFSWLEWSDQKEQRKTAQEISSWAITLAALDKAKKSAQDAR